jgi:outer membrane protein OmpA-like peptidoglycan-associated protein
LRVHAFGVSPVRDDLVTKGLDGSALRTVGYGKSRLVRPGAQGTADGAELNRRVTFVIETPAGAASVAALSGM